jgi:hypothetical protein
MKTHWGVEVWLHSFFDLGTRWRWMVSFTTRPLYPRERAPSTHWIGGWVGSRAVLDAVMKKKCPAPRRESNPRTSTFPPVAQRYTQWNIKALRRNQEHIKFREFLSTTVQKHWLSVSYPKTQRLKYNYICFRMGIKFFSYLKGML